MAPRFLGGRRLGAQRQGRQDHAKAAKPLATLALLAFQACEPGTPEIGRRRFPGAPFPPDV